MLTRRTLLPLLLLVAGSISAAPPLPDEPPLADAPLLPPEAPEVCQAEPPTPIVSLRVRVAATTAAGQELEYRIRVSNQSQASAHHVIVRNPLPVNARFVRAVPEPAVRNPEVVWRLGTLRAGQCRDLVLVLRPDGGDVSSCARVSFEHGQCVTTRIAQPALTIRKTAPATSTLYEAIVFRIEVVNTGSSPLSDVVVTDVLPRELRYMNSKPPLEQRALLTWGLGTLQPGERRAIEYQAASTQEGTFSNRAVVTAAGGLRQEAISRISVGKARLSLALLGPERNYTNLPASYDLTVSNPGNAAANNVTVTAALPAGVRLIAASDGGQQSQSEVRWLLGNFAPGAKRTLKLEVGAATAGELQLRAAARGDGDLTAQAEVKTMFQGVAGLTASLTDTDPVEVNREVPYSLVIRNPGSDTTNDVRVVATIPEQMQLTDSQGPSKAVAQGGKVIFEPITIKANEEVRYTIYVKAVRPGDVRFRVEITARELTAGPLLKEESTTIFEETPAR